jgi:hypothetical protein
MRRVRLWSFKDKLKIMIRNLILIGILLATVEVRAEKANGIIEIETLMSVPEKRHAALVLYAITTNDSTPDISTK